MKNQSIHLLSAALVALEGAPAPAAPAPNQHNAIVFVADGLRGGSVTPDVAPNLWALAHEGVWFTNSHSRFPTVTTANASVIATGHAQGDTGNYGNTLFTGYPIPGARHDPTVTPALEANSTLLSLHQHFQDCGGYLGPDSLLARARERGYSTAAVGKRSAVLIQDISQYGANGDTILIDDYTGQTNGIPLDPGLYGLLTNAVLAGQVAGKFAVPGKGAPNIRQQASLVDAVTKVILPMFKARHRPFALVFWSRDPDYSQHYHTNRLESLEPGINGDTCKAAVSNADHCLAQLRDSLRKLGLEDTTDIFVTADHGFDTISKGTLDASGTQTASFAAHHAYHADQGNPDRIAGYLPYGFLAIDLAEHLKLPLFDPDTVTNGAYPEVKAALGQSPSEGNGLIGGTGRLAVNDPHQPTVDAELVVTEGGGSDFIYVPADLVRGRLALHRDLVARVVEWLTRQDYVSGVFVDDKYCRQGEIAGALRLSQIGLVGSAGVPRPAIIVSFRSFSTGAAGDLQHGVLIADADRRQGQGDHGAFARSDTFNFMAACGPDFKRGYVDPAPVSNADLAHTLGAVLGLPPQRGGGLTGRVISEACEGKPEAKLSAIHRGIEKSAEANGVCTILNWQKYQGQRYYDAAGFAGRTLGLQP